MDTEPLLLIAALMLGCAWLGYRGERDQHAATVRDLMRRPTDSAAVLSAISAAIARIEHAATRNCAVDRAAQATRPKLDPLPGMQAKPKARRPEQRKTR